jgi:uncharacterized membrane protein YhaH (DUF805 family)
MDIQRQFLSAGGRSGRGEFWIGFIILWVLGWILNFIPGIGHWIAMLLIYPWICIFSRRLHDMGRSGWTQLVMWGVWIVAVVLALVLGAGGAIMAMANGGHADYGALAGAGLAFLVLCLALLINLVFVLWVGLSPSQAGDNAYGPPPGAAQGAASAA